MSLQQFFDADVSVVSETNLYKRVYVLPRVTQVSGPGELEYTLATSIQFYSNYLAWFYETFLITEKQLRKALFSEFPCFDGASVLLTGVGLGQELIYVLELIRDKQLRNVRIYAQDFSSLFIDHVASLLSDSVDPEVLVSLNTQVVLFDGDATKLPLNDDLFDYCHHFGGINRFSSTQQAIYEMARVLKKDDSSRVMFSDESVAPWLRNTDIGCMVIENNSLYGADVPLDMLPPTASNVKTEWICQNCFYKISFSATFSTESIYPHVKHKSPRGGTMFTRYYGKLEGVNPVLKERLSSYANSCGTSLADVMSECISDFLNSREN